MSDDPMLVANSFRVLPLLDTRGVSIRELLALRFRTTDLEMGFSQYCLPISLFQSRIAFCMACVLLIGDYVADAIFYGLASSPANILRVAVVAPAFFCFFLISYLAAVQRRYDLYVSIFYSFVSSFLFLVIYLIDRDGGNGISNTVGFLNLFFILIFGFVLIGTRFYYSLTAASVVTVVFIYLLYRKLDTESLLYYLLYQIFTVFCLCVLLGYTREFVLRAGFATQAELAQARLAKERTDLRYLDWLRSLATFLRHEVRQPIAQIHSSLELMQLALTTESLTEYATIASNGVQHVWNLIERASRATDAEAFVRQGHLQSTDLAALLVENVEIFRQTNSGVYFRLQCPRTLSAYADPTLIKEAIGNLLGNAVSFADEQSTVEIMLETIGLHAFVKVSNKGPPIEGDADMLFSPFSSTRSGHSNEHVGLGLYLVRLIAEQHDGTASICNFEDGSGVVAMFSIPLRTRAETDHDASYTAALK